MDNKNCAKCGKWFSTIKATPLCPLCEKNEEETFRLVKQYIDENPHSTTAEVADATGISVKKILKYLKEGRIEATKGMRDDIKCDACGKPVSRGRYCESCRLKINQEVTDIFSADAPAQPSQANDNERNQFYTASSRSSPFKKKL